MKRLLPSSFPIILLWLLVTLWGCNRNEPPILTQEQSNYLRLGDILFQDLDCGDLCNAIEEVTVGVGGAHISHMGVVSSIDNGKIMIFESYSDGVVETPLEEFISRSLDKEGRPKVLITRLKPVWQPSIKRVVPKVEQWKGKPYDPDFEMDNESYYCSEVIYHLFNGDGKENNPFYPSPMTFIDPSTGEVHPFWKKYYEKQGIPIPEGKPGLNPALMSRSEALEVVYRFGDPEGFKS